MEKIFPIKLKKIISVSKTPVTTNTTDSSNENAYLKMKSMQSAYQELFRALLKLPDKEVVTRVIAAINASGKKSKTTIEMVTCEKCKQPISKAITIDVGTQTTFFNATTQKTTTTTTTKNSDEPCDLTVNSDESRSTPINGTENLKEEPTEITNDVTPKVKRKRRRKTQLPKVIKKSQVQQQQRPILLKRKAEKISPINNNISDPLLSSTKIPRRESVSSTCTNISSILSDGCMEEIYNDETHKAIYTPDALLSIMCKELTISEAIQGDGLIPIHSAIANNQYLPMQRQIYIWKKFKKINMNELLTDDDQDCLQLAIESNTSCEIINALLQSGLNVNSLDVQSNTLIHLAIHNEIDVNACKVLMEQIDINMMLQLNDDGYTPLHLAVRKDNFILAEAILNALDKRLFGGPTYTRNTETTTKASFLLFYESCCEQIAQDCPLVKYEKKQRNIKQKLINAGEMRSGNTALFFAIENKMEHLIYLLLAHLANPLIVNHSGQDVKSYFGEFAKMLNLSLKIDRVMEQVNVLLK